MCQPGLPFPQGDSQNGSPGLQAFHNAKSKELFLLPLGEVNGLTSLISFP